MLRTHALAAGLDPEFTVLDEHRAAELSGAAFEDALAELARSPGGGGAGRRTRAGRAPAGLLAAHGQLRAIGQRRRGCPPPRERCGARSSWPTRVASARPRRGWRARRDRPAPGQRIVQALDTLSRADELLARGVPWPGDLAAVTLRNGAKALTSEACEAYRAGLEELRAERASELAIADA